MNDNQNFDVGDFVICTDKQYFGVTGIVIKKYFPTASEQQTMIETSEGRKFHAPTRYFLKTNL